jgi:hypothetical protein
MLKVSFNPQDRVSLIALREIANVLLMQIGNEPVPVSPVTTDTEASTSAPVPAPAPAPVLAPVPTLAPAPVDSVKRGPGRPRKTPAVVFTPTVSLDNVRALMVEKAKVGGEAMMAMQKSLLASYQVLKLSDLPTESLAEFYRKVEAL